MTSLQVQTVELRVQAGWNNFKRLHPWLCRKHKISLQLKLEQMRTCIIPTICYGILFVGLQQTGIQLVCQTLHQMYRRIVGILPHRTRDTHSTVLDSFQIEPPLLVLRQLVNQAHQSLTTTLTLVHPQDVIHQINWLTLNDTRTLLTSALCQLDVFPESDRGPEEVACIYCAFIAPTLLELQSHHTLVHALPRPLIRQVDYRQDTPDGMPQCKRCKMFMNWRSFKSHCRANVCGAIHNKPTVISTPVSLEWGLEDPVSLEYHDRAMVFAVEADYASARGDRKLWSYESHEGHRCSREIQSSRTTARSHCFGYTAGASVHGECVPMQFLQYQFQQSASMSKVQFAVLELIAATPDDPLHFTCFLCQFIAADRQQLKKHLPTLHQFPCHDWTPARDSLPNQVTCAHCGSVHHCQEALRKHIIYGHCPQFDAARPCTRKGDADVVEHLSMWGELT